MAVCDEILYSNPLIYIIYEDCYKIKNKNHHTFYEMMMVLIFYEIL